MQGKDLMSQPDTLTDDGPMLSVEQGGGPPGGPAILNKVYRNTLPLVCLIAALCYIDRTNLAYASFSLTRDLSFSPSVYGTGSGLFFVGYSFAMIPSQLLGLRIGVLRWLSILVSLWGVVAACFSAITSVTQFYVLRFLLGVAEAGAFPAIWYYLYLMLPKDALTLPFSALEAAVSTANVLSAPIAAGLLLLETTGGLKGWQWLFMCEGAVTVVVGLACGVLLPSGLAQAAYLSSPERRWIQQQQGRGWQGQAKDDAEVFQDWRVVREAFTNWRVWYLSVMGIFKAMAGNAMLFWLPIMVASLMGSDAPDTHDGLQALAAQQLAGGSNSTALDPPSHARAALAAAALLGSNSTAAAAPQERPSLSLPVLLSSIPFMCTAVLAVLLGRSSQARGERSLHLALPYLVAGLLFSALGWLKAVAPALAFVALCIAIACTVGSNCISNAFIPAVCSSTSVSVAMALYNSVSNLGGILGPWVIGVLVEHTGGYDSATQLLGVVMLVAAAMAWSTQSWEAATSRSPVKQQELATNRSVGVSLERLNLLSKLPDEE